MSIFEIRSFLGLAGYYWRFENWLKLSITGHGLHGWGGPDHGEREIKDTWNTRDTGVGNKREDQLSPSSGKRQKTSA